MKKGQIYQGVVTKVDFPNKAYVKIEGEDIPVVVKNAVEGQKVSVFVNKKKRDKAEGNIKEVEIVVHEPKDIDKLIQYMVCR